MTRSSAWELTGPRLGLEAVRDRGRRSMAMAEVVLQHPAAVDREAPGRPGAEGDLTMRLGLVATLLPL